MLIQQAPNQTTQNKILTPTTVFLAGGITGCRNWQSDVIEELEAIDESGLISLKNLIVFNPRRDHFDVEDKNESITQIKWEHERLKRCDICSFFFDNSESLQPITLYELGKYCYVKSSLVTVIKGYKRELDVKVQMALEGQMCLIFNDYNEAIKHHAMAIALAYKEIGKGK